MPGPDTEKGLPGLYLVRRKGSLPLERASYSQAIAEIKAALSIPGDSVTITKVE